MAEKLFKNELPDPPEKSPLWDSNDSLGEKIEKVFIRFFQSIILWIYEFFAELVVQIFDASMKILKPGMMRMFTPVIDKIEKTPGIPDYLKAMIVKIKEEKGEAGAIGVGLFVVAALYQFIGALIQPLTNLTTQGVNQLIPNTLLDPTIAAAANLRGILTDAEYLGILDNAGYGDRDKQVLRSMTQNFPTIFEAIEFVRRGLYDKNDFDLAAKRLRLDTTTTANYYELVKEIPPLQDLIRFMVREAFSDSISAKFGYDNDYPAEIAKYLPRLGLDADWGKRYWRAHWTLPSPTQAYEMLHRGVIDEKTLDELLKTSDYPEFWREKLMQISYNVMTRVDIRRFLQTGVITRERALKAYKEMGYTDEIAEYQVQFAERGISQDEKDLSRADMVGMYVDGLIDGGALTQALVKMGYDGQEADAVLKQADFDIAKNARMDVMNFAKEQFAAGKVDKVGAQSELYAAGFSEKAVSRYILSWERAKQSEVKGLSQADARRLFGKDLLDETGLREALKVLKYDEASIELLVKEAIQDKAESMGEV